MYENEIKSICDDLTVILDGNKEILVKRADEIGKELGRTLSTSQLRNIFYEVKGMNFDNIEKLHLLRPKLAYIAGRHGKRRKGELTGGIVILQKIMDDAIKMVFEEKTKERFENFQEFFEAILAYHKYYGHD